MLTRAQAVAELERIYEILPQMKESQLLSTQRHRTSRMCMASQWELLRIGNMES